MMVRIREHTFLSWHHIESVEATSGRVHIRTASGLTHSVHCDSEAHAKEHADFLVEAIDVARKAEK